MSYSKHRRGRIFPLINAQLFPTMYNVERIPHKAYFGRVHAVALDSLKNYGLVLQILTGKVQFQVIIKDKTHYI